ncbi:MAG: hypothetical protein WBG27_15640 [Candidatus Aquilonibacter sp.]
MTVSMLLPYVLLAATTVSSPTPSATRPPYNCVVFVWKSKAVADSVGRSHETPSADPNKMGPVWRKAYDSGDLSFRECRPGDPTPHISTPVPSPTP